MQATRVEHTFRDSTRVDRAWFTESSSQIEIEFPDGVRFLFFNCDKQTWMHFIQAPSAGKFLREILERHPYRRR